MKKAILLFVVCCSLFASAQECEVPSVNRVLVVGDSISAYLMEDGSLNRVFSSEGRADVLAKGDITALPGKTSMDWASTEYLQLITDELDANPTIDIVQITVGINDVFRGSLIENGYQFGMSLEDETAYFNTIAANIRTLVDHINAIRSDISIAYVGYDYFNLDNYGGPEFGEILCEYLLNLTGNPDQAGFNQAHINLENIVFDALDDVDNVTTISTRGLMQYSFGVPEAGIQPETLYMPGDDTLGGPGVAFRYVEFPEFGPECIHFNASANDVLAGYLWNVFYRDALCISGREFADAIVNCVRSGGHPTNLLWMLEHICF